MLDGAYGTFFSSFVDDWAPELLTHDLGSDWKIMRVGFKPAPASPFTRVLLFSPLALPEATLESVDDAGHYPEIEQPVTTSELVQKFIS